MSTPENDAEFASTVRALLRMHGGDSCLDSNRGLASGCSLWSDIDDNHQRIYGSPCEPITKPIDAAKEG